MICQLVDIEYCPGTPTVMQKVCLTSLVIIADSARSTCNSCVTSYVECLTINPNAVKKVDNLHGYMVVRSTTIR